MISNICIHAERIYIEYLGASLLDMERVMCKCYSLCRNWDEFPREVDREDCEYCGYAEFNQEKRVQQHYGWGELESSGE